MRQCQPMPSLVQIMACRLFGDKPLSEPMLYYYTPGFNEVERGVYWYHLVRLSICGQNRVRSASSTILIGSISYLHILSSNFRRCVACNARFKIQKSWGGGYPQNAGVLVVLVVNCTLRNKLQSNCIRNSNIFIQEIAFENNVWKMSAILSVLQCVDTGSATRFHEISATILNDIIGSKKVTPGAPFTNMD